MLESYSHGGSSHPYIPLWKLKELKKKALQSYKKIPMIEKKSDNEKKKAGEEAEEKLKNFR